MSSAGKNGKAAVDLRGLQQVLPKNPEETMESVSTPTNPSIVTAVKLDETMTRSSDEKTTILFGTVTEEVYAASGQETAEGRTDDTAAAAITEEASTPEPYKADNEAADGGAIAGAEEQAADRTDSPAVIAASSSAIDDSGEKSFADRLDEASAYESLPEDRTMDEQVVSLQVIEQQDEATNQTDERVLVDGSSSAATQTVDRYCLRTLTQVVLTGEPFLQTKRRTFPALNTFAKIFTTSQVRVPINKDGKGMEKTWWQAAEMTIASLDLDSLYHEYDNQLAHSPRFNPDLFTPIDIIGGSWVNWSNRGLRLNEAPDTEIARLMKSSVIPPHYPLSNSDMERLEDSLRVPDDLRKEVLDGEKNIHEKITFLQEKGVIITDNSFGTLECCKLGEFIQTIIYHRAEALTDKVRNALTDHEQLLSKRVVNVDVFGFATKGVVKDAYVLDEVFFRRIFLDNDTLRAKMYLTITPYEFESDRRLTKLWLDVKCEINLTQRTMCNIFSDAAGHVMLISSGMSEIAGISDACWESFFSFEDLDKLDELRDYSGTNIVDLVPLMAIAGVLPPASSDPRVEGAWRTSVDRLIEDLCRLNETFLTNESRMRFIGSLSRGLQMAGSLCSVEEGAKFLVQFVLWACDEDEELIASFVEVSTTGWMLNSSVNALPHYAAQVLWLASVLTADADICRIGFKYLPDIIMYNTFYRGEVCVKTIKSGFWLSSVLSSTIDRDAETASLTARMEAFGFLLLPEGMRIISSTRDISIVVALVCRAANDWAERMRTVGGVKARSLTEAMLSVIEVRTAFELGKADDETPARLAYLSTTIGAKMSDALVEAGIERNLAYNIVVSMISTTQAGLESMAADNSEPDLASRTVAVASESNRLIEAEVIEEAETALEVVEGRPALTVEEVKQIVLSGQEIAQREVVVSAALNDATRAFNTASRQYEWTGLERPDYRSSLFNGGVTTAESRVTYTDKIGRVPISVIETKIKSDELDMYSMSITTSDVRALTLNVISSTPDPTNSRQSTVVGLSAILLEALDFNMMFSINMDRRKMAVCLNRLVMPSPLTSNYRAPMIGDRVSTISVNRVDDNGEEETVVIRIMSESDLSLGRLVGDLAKHVDYLRRVCGNVPAYVRAYYYIAMIPSSVVVEGTVVLRYVADVQIVSIRKVLDLIDSREKDDTAANANVVKLKGLDYLEQGGLIMRSLVAGPLIKFQGLLEKIYDLAFLTSVGAVMVNHAAAASCHKITIDMVNVLVVMNSSTPEELDESYTSTPLASKAIALRSDEANSKSWRITKALLRLLSIPRLIIDLIRKYIIRPIKAAAAKVCQKSADCLNAVMSKLSPDKSRTSMLRPAASALMGPLKTAATCYEAREMVANGLEDLKSYSPDAVELGKKLAAAKLKAADTPIGLRLGLSKTKAQLSYLALRTGVNIMAGVHYSNRTAVSGIKAAASGILKALMLVASGLNPVTMARTVARWLAALLLLDKLFNREKKPAKENDKEIGQVDNDEPDKDDGEGGNDASPSPCDIADETKAPAASSETVAEDPEGEPAPTSEGPTRVTEAEMKRIIIAAGKKPAGISDEMFAEQTISYDGKVYRVLKIPTKKLTNADNGQATDKDDSYADDVREKCDSATPSVDTNDRPVNEVSSCASITPLGTGLVRKAISGATDYLLKKLTTSAEDAADAKQQALINTRVSGIKLEVGDCSKATVVEKLMAEESCSGIESLFASEWEELPEDFEMQQPECQTEIEKTVLTLVGKKKMMEHGKLACASLNLNGQKINVVDLNSISLLVLPLMGSVVLPQKMDSAELTALVKKVSRWRITRNASRQLAFPANRRGVVTAFETVALDTKMEHEVLVTPRHAWPFGMDSPQINSVDEMITLACAHRDSVVADLIEADEVLDLIETDRKQVIAHNVYKVQSEYFVLVTANGVDWGGKSGCPVLDVKKRMIGVLMMQVMVEGGVKAVGDEALLLVCTKLDGGRPIVAARDMTVMRCKNCSSKWKPPAQNHSESSDESHYDSADEIFEVVNDVTACSSLLSESSWRTERDNEANSIRRNRPSAETTNNTKLTGALEETAERLAAQGFSRNARLVVSEKQVIDLLTEAVRFNKAGDLGQLTTALLQETIKAMVKKTQIFMLFSETSAALAFSSCLGVFKVKYTMLRTANDYRKASTADNSMRYWVNVIMLEDVLTWVATDTTRLIGPKHSAIRLLVVRPDDETDASWTYLALRALLLSATEASVVTYDGAVDPAHTLKEEGKADQTYMNAVLLKPFQCSGFMVRMAVQNERITEADSLAVSEERHANAATCLVIGFSHSVADMTAMRKRASTLCSKPETAIIYCHASKWASDDMWEVVSNCEQIFWCTSTTADNTKKTIPNVRLSRCPSSPSVRMMSDAIRLAAMANEDHKVLRTLIVSSQTMLDRAVGFKKDDAVVETTGRSKGSAHKLNKSQLELKSSSLIVAGLAVTRQSDCAKDKLKAIRAEGSLRLSVLKDSDVLGDDAVCMKVIEIGLWQMFKNALRRSAAACRWYAYRLRTAVAAVYRKATEKIMSQYRRVRQAAKNSAKKLTMALNKLVFKAKNRVSSTADYSVKERESGMTGLAWRSASMGLAVSWVTKVGQTVLDPTARLRNAACACLCWGLIEYCSSDEKNRPSSTIIRVGNAITSLSNSVFLYCLVTGNKVTIGTPMITAVVSIATAVEAALRLKKIAKEVAKAHDLTFQVKPTSQIVHNWPYASTTGFLLEACRSAAAWNEFLYQLLLKCSMRDMFNSLWAGIKHRNDNPTKQATGLITAVPCVGYAEVASMSIVGTAGVCLAVKMARWRASNSAAQIGVFSDRKHTADIISIYVKDRSCLTTVTKIVNLAAGSLALLNANSSAGRWAGGIVVALTVADQVFGSSSIGNVSHESATIIARTYWSNHKFSTAGGAMLNWLFGYSIPALGANAIIITSRESASHSEALTHMSRRWGQACQSEQEKEKMMNANLTDLSLDPMEAYGRCKQIMGLNRDETEDFTNIRRWDVDTTSMDKTIDFNVVVTGKVRPYDEAKPGSVRLLSEITVNQCRYLGRTRRVYNKREEDKLADDESKQASVLFLDERLWAGVVKEENRAGFGAAKDRRVDVLMAIVERNDAEPKFDLTPEILDLCCGKAVNLLTELMAVSMLLEANTGPLDWLMATRTVNAKATSGILSRVKKGIELGAGYIGNHPERCELCKEMILDGNDRSEMHAINVFAKRRIEKKKISKLTGDDCVITRTIQANEVAVKMSVAEAFLVTDKLLKLTRRRTGVSLGLNLFTEYSEDDLASVSLGMEATKRAGRGRVMRVSLDHSSFDSSQRNWSVELMRLFRTELASAKTDSKKQRKGVADYLSKCYRRLKLRIMLTTSGDLFALTGQQMSGHATTSSDNSIKSLIYAESCAELMEKEGLTELVRGSIRVQGDDTKMVVHVKDGVSDHDVSEGISRAMKTLGQNVKGDKIKLSEWFEGCDFLANKTEVRLFKVADNHGSWLEPHWVPLREIDEIMAMCATTLKQTDKRETKKTKKDVRLMAAKSVSFAIMYGCDYIIAKYCSTICWAASKILKAAGKIGERTSIMADNLPWLMVQSGMAGDYELDFNKVMMMHSISRALTKETATHWVVHKTVKGGSHDNAIYVLQRNFENVYHWIKNWQWETVNDAFGLMQSDACVNLLEADVSRATEAMMGTFSETIRIVDANIEYEPFLRLKREAMANSPVKALEHNDNRVVVVKERDEKHAELNKHALELALNITFDETERLTTLTSEGIVVYDLEVSKSKAVDDTEVWLVNDTEAALILEARPWNIYQLVRPTVDSRLVDVRVLKRSMAAGPGSCVMDERSLRTILNTSELVNETRLEADKVCEKSLLVRGMLRDADSSDHKKLVVLDRGLN